MSNEKFCFLRIERQDRVVILTLNRPEALNALNTAMAAEIAKAVRKLDTDDGVGCILIKGEGKAFCAGADIKEALSIDFPRTLTGNYLVELGVLAEARKPVVAAVTGPALGGGCELAMMCDIILADETARFGLPEVRLGVMPGAGGTQRLALALGKAKAMEICLTGRALLSEEAERLGLITRIVPKETLFDDALAVAQTISNYSLPATMAIKEALAASFDGLGQGLRLERRLFHSLYATQDRREGMQAFAEKRTPSFQHK